MDTIDIKKNYFELFDLPAQYRLNASDLDRRYQELQKQTHPDRYSAEGEHSQRLALQAASYVNSAYTTLSDPMARAIYLLECDGIDMQAHSHALPADFLAEQIHLRERLERAADNHVALEKLLLDLRAESKLLLRQLSDQLDIHCHDKSILSVQKLQFIKKIQEQTEAVLFELELKNSE